MVDPNVSARLWKEYCDLRLKEGLGTIPSQESEAALKRFFDYVLKK